MDALLQDVRYAVASMRRNKGFAAAALATLALGIGATTAVFSVVYGVLLRPLPYAEASRIVRLSEEHPGAVSPLRAPMLSNLTYYAWSAAPRTVERFAAYRSSAYTVTRDGASDRLEGADVTPSLFPMLGETPALGRFFRDEDALTGRAPVIVLSDRGWRERFSSDPAIIGRGIEVDGTPATIVGVARPGLAFPDADVRLWMPLIIPPPSTDATAARRGRVSVQFALARLEPGVTPAQAEAEGTAAARSMARPMAANLLFGIGGRPIVHVRGMVDEMTSRVRPALLVLAAGVVCVLLIACANVANLFLSRGIARERELTVRAAIGASRARLARQLLTESLVLSGIGGALGLGLAAALVAAAPSFAAAGFPRLDAVRVDARAVVCAIVATIATAIASGLAPALRSARVNLNDSLHGGDGASAGGFRGARGGRLRDTLLAAEAAFAVLLLVGAILLARSFVKLTHVDAGYTADGVLAVQVYVPGGNGDQRAARTQELVWPLIERVRAVPGVVAAGAGNMMPLDNATMIAGFPPPWTRPGAEPTNARALLYLVTPGYQDALGLRVRQGRLFSDADRASGTRGWVVNQEFARLYLPPQPLGYRFEQPSETSPIPVEIVGIVANVLKDGNDRKPQPEVYQVPRERAQAFGSRFELTIRTASAPSSIASAVRAIVHDALPAAAIEAVPLSRRVAESVDQPRFAAAVLGAFALLALVLASVGLYGVLSYAVARRRRELGVRAALGAARRDLVGLIMREGLATTAIGLGLGLTAAAGLTRFMRGALFGVAPLDLSSFIAAPIVLALVAAAACLLPAHRAAATDPAEALRCE
ncbi:MAG TPA: ADOP family duplicated permease [Vicinamibacterales bacterium]|nr:ADOP family duplicated permease [Vicinamibacterales bacterium]